MISSFTLLPFRSRAIRHFRSQHRVALSFPANFMITMWYYSYSAIYLCEWRLNVHDEVARTKKKGVWIIHPLASTSIAMKNWAASVHDGKFRYRYRSSTKSLRHRIRALIYITHTLTDGFSSGRICHLRGWFAGTEQFLYLWIILFAGSKSLLWQQQPRDRVGAEQRAVDPPVVAGNWRIRSRLLCWLSEATSLIFSRAK